MRHVLLLLTMTIALSIVPRPASPQEPSVVLGEAAPVDVGASGISVDSAAVVEFDEYFREEKGLSELFPIVVFSTSNEEEWLPRPANPKDILRNDDGAESDVVQSARGNRGNSISVVRLAGGDVELRTDAQAVVDFAYDTGFVGTDVQFVPTDVALDGSPEANQRGHFLGSGDKVDEFFNATSIGNALQSSNVAFDLQALRSFGIPAQVYSEFDFLSGRVRPRHLLARGGDESFFVAAGESWTNFGDQDARPRSLVAEYAPAGNVFRRPLQLRITKSFQNGINATIAGEQPVKDDFMLAGSSEFPHHRWPDAVLRLRYEPAKYEFGQVSMIVRQVGVEEVNGQSRAVMGWGVSGMVSRKVTANDRVQAGAVFGDGIGSYLYGLGETTNSSVVDGTRLRRLGAQGAHIGYIHTWTETIKSNVAYGYAYADTTAALLDTSPNKTQNAWVNLLWWNAKKKAACGIEYGYVMHHVNDGRTGENHRIQFTVVTGIGPNDWLTRSRL